MAATTFERALAEAVGRIRRIHTSFDQQFPTVGLPDDDARYERHTNDTWMSGFWTGLLWLAYAETGDPALRAHAEALLPTFEKRLEQRTGLDHDLGFLYLLSARAQWQLNRDTHAKDVALRAAAKLVKRFRPEGGYIQAWGEVGSPGHNHTIIDSLMNMPLLFWAAAETGESRYRDAALTHVETCRKYLLRPDGSTYHSYFFDPETGTPTAPRTHQGYVNDSLWARGQAWAICGFALAAEWSGDARYREAAVQAARRFMAELPPDGLPTWDLRLAEDAPRYTDTSASVIATAGLLRLARQDPGATADWAVPQAHRLLEVVVACCGEGRPEAEGLLRGGTYHAVEGVGVETYFIPGDYFYLESLLAIHNRAPDFWGRG
jgi:unsaturated chondroitin disaccharide hydrolase